MGRRAKKNRLPDRQQQASRPDRSGSTAEHRYRVPVVCSLLLLAIALVFGQTLRHEFVNYDDKQYVTENPEVTQGLTRIASLGPSPLATPAIGTR